MKMYQLLPEEVLGITVGQMTAVLLEKQGVTEEFIHRYIENINKKLDEVMFDIGFITVNGKNEIWQITYYYDNNRFFVKHGMYYRVLLHIEMVESRLFSIFTRDNPRAHKLKYEERFLIIQRARKLLRSVLEETKECFK